MSGQYDGCVYSADVRMEMFKSIVVNEDGRFVHMLEPQLWSIWFHDFRSMLCITASAMNRDICDSIGTPMFCL